MDDFVGAKFYCPHALAGGNQLIQIRKKVLEISSTVSYTVSVHSYLYLVKNYENLT